MRFTRFFILVNHFFLIQFNSNPSWALKTQSSLLFCSRFLFLLRFHHDKREDSSASAWLFNCASTTAITAICVIFRTVLPSCKICTGFFRPNKIGPIAPPGQCFAANKVLEFPAGLFGQMILGYFSHNSMPRKTPTECGLGKNEEREGEENVAEEHMSFMFYVVRITFLGFKVLALRFKVEEFLQSSAKTCGKCFRTLNSISVQVSFPADFRRFIRRFS